MLASMHAAARSSGLGGEVADRMLLWTGCLAGLLGVTFGSACTPWRATAAAWCAKWRTQVVPEEWCSLCGLRTFTCHGHDRRQHCLPACMRRVVGGFSPPPAALSSAWHPRQPWVAAAHAAGAVHVLDMSLGLPSGGSRPAGQRSEFLTNAARTVLTHGSQRGGVYAAAWCPTSPGQLAVGVVGGVNVWNVAGEARPPLPGGRVGGPWLRRLHLSSPDAP